MSIQDILSVVGAIAISFGGGAAIVIGLSAYLADLYAKRTLQRESSRLQEGLEAIKHELGLARSSYEHYLDLVLDYYQVFYRHYRLCQRTASADAYRELLGGTITDSRDEFFEKLDDFLSAWAAQEGKIRLLLPARLLEIHGEAVDSFNEFKRAVDAFRKDEITRQAKVDAFAKVENVKVRLESGIREFLRTERLLK